ncbi:unnamed protein product [uncultured bacterium]|nr:unnamed protein product [uncultured bacterium]
MKRESTLSVQSETPPKYAGKEVTPIKAARLRPPEGIYSPRRASTEPQTIGGRGRSKAGEQTITKTFQPAPKIFGKKRGRMACNFTETDVQAECVRREQELEDAELLALDGGRFISASEAALDDLEDVEFCRDLVSKFAPRSAKKTGDTIGGVHDRYDTIMIELLSARYTHTDGKRYSLGTVLRDKYEPDTALKEFLSKFGKWISDYVSDCVREHSFGFTPLYRQIVPSHTWSLCNHSVSRELLTALAEEYVRDRKGLMQFLSAVFKRWRKIYKLGSSWQILLVKSQLLGRNDKGLAAAIEKTSVFQDNPRTEKQHDRLMWRIRQCLKREREELQKKEKKKGRASGDKNAQCLLICHHELVA